MKWIFILLASLMGLVGGAFVSYFLVGPVYLIYAHFNPLDPSAECARGGGIAWLSLLFGAIFGAVKGATIVLRQVNETTATESPTI
jgi:membrane associated rhomboid family serine protease